MRTIRNRTQLTIWLCICLLAYGCTSPTNTATTPKPITTYQLTKTKKATLHDNVFGQFLEKASWGGEQGAEAALKPGSHELQDGLTELLQAMHIPVLRFPGGTDVDYLDWQGMIDHVPEKTDGRPPFYRAGDTVTQRFGYDEAGRLAEKLQAEMILVVNFGDAYLNKKEAQEAAMYEAALIAYCAADTHNRLPAELRQWPKLRATNGHPEPYPIKYIQFANEPWIFDADLKIGGAIPKSKKAHYFDCMAVYLETFNRLFPDLKIIVDGNCQELTQPLKQKFGNQIDLVAAHVYKPWGIKHFEKEGNVFPCDSLSDEQIWYGWTSVPDIDSSGLSVFRSDMYRRAKGSGYPVAMTEWNWNGWWATPSKKESQLNEPFTKGLGAAGFVHAMIREANHIPIAIQSMLLGNAWGITAIRVSPDGQQQPYLMPTGQVTALYAQHHGNEVLELTYDHLPKYNQPFKVSYIEPADSVAYIDAVATKSDEALFFHAINRHYSDSLTIAIDLSHWQTAATATHYILTEVTDGQAPYKYATIKTTEIRKQKGEEKILVTLPKRSVNVVKLALQ